uniref:Uncharacterized protein n=1 Tax=Knipowitschia caucasica TaxID=637954 RepID=A0AAV2JXN1_KNICA
MLIPVCPPPPAPSSSPSPVALYPIGRWRLQCNALWQPHTCSGAGHSEVHWSIGVLSCSGGQERAGGRDSPPACDWWYGSVSEPICHVCPCHFASAPRPAALAASEPADRSLRTLALALRPSLCSYPAFTPLMRH